MVFESLVVDLVNKYLGDFIENLDKSQLKIGIWGGDVVLNDLFIKQSALDDLELPVKVLHGNLGKLTLKIPWKNLYGEPTVAILDGLYLLAVPNMGIQYNAEKEAKAAFEAKQKELQRIEDAKKAEAEKNKPKDEKADSFAEKLATNVIKNLQVEISNIHVRYEDHFTNPNKPFAAGVTLQNLSFQTTDANWKPMVIKEAVTMIYKMIKLESLAVYWNSEPQFYTVMDRQLLQASLKKNIAAPGYRPAYNFLVEPITSSAQLRLHTRPEKDDFSLPKILLNVVFHEIAVALTQAQYQNVMEMLESMERMVLASKYRKYRPAQPKRGHSKVWWRFAYSAILEEVVRRRRRMWSWQHIRHHRQLCRQYKDAYKKKLTSKKVSNDLQQQLEVCEKQLSVFNITLQRQQAELEIQMEEAAKKEKKKVKKEGAKKAESGGGGWFGGWFGGGGKKQEKASEDIGDQFAKLMTAEEKKKMFDAIGYQENAADPTLPIEYVATKVHFKLGTLSLTLRGDAVPGGHAGPGGGQNQVLRVELADVFAGVTQRPAASAVRIESKMDSFTVLGMPCVRTGQAPRMVSSQTAAGDQVQSLLTVLFETNPLDGSCDARVNVESRPLQIIYDANTIIQITDFFKPPESVHLKQLQAAAMSKFEDLKEQTATGLQHAISLRKYTDISVNLMPSYVIVPHTGIYTENCRVLLLDLGNLRVWSEKTVGAGTPTTPTSPSLSMTEVKEKAYDKFHIQLQNIQLLLANPGESWSEARKSQGHKLHILRPMDLRIDLDKSILVDPNLPKIKVRGELPSLQVNISDRKLQDMVELFTSIPFPEGDKSTASQQDDDIDYNAPDIGQTVAVEGNADALVRQMAAATVDSSDDEFVDAEEELPSATKKKQRATVAEYVNAIDVQLDFLVKEICVSMSQLRVSPGGQEVEVPMVKVVVDSLGTAVTVRTWDLAVDAFLGGVYIQHLQFKASDALKAWYGTLGQSTALYEDGPLINLVNTPVTDDSTYRLLHVHYLKADRRGRQFATTYNSTEQKLSVHFTALEVLLHQEAILSLLAFAQTLIPPPKESAVKADTLTAAQQTATAQAKSGGKSAAVAKSAIQEEIAAQKRRRLRDSEIIDIVIEANMDVFAVAICTQETLVTDLNIKGVEAKVTVQKSKTMIGASLKDLSINDPTPGAMYPKILAFEGGEVFSLDVVAYNGATEGESYNLMDVVDTSIGLHTGTMKVVFLNKFVMNVLAFTDNFQKAKDKLAEAGSAAAETAAKAAQDFSHRATRVQLDIALKAPVIIVPQNSMSSNALLVDLGLITVTNTFAIAGRYNEAGLPAVLDRMSVTLSAMKLARANMLGLEVRADVCILQPVNLKLCLVRNLSAGWYHGHPDIDVDGQLESFTLELSQGDFTTLMSVLNENLNEAAPKVADSKGVPDNLGSDAATASSFNDNRSNNAEVSAVTAEVTQNAPGAAQEPPKTGVLAGGGDGEVYAKVKFAFNILSIQAQLYNGDSNLVSGLAAREAKKTLAKFELQNIGVEGNMKSDNSIKALVALHQIVLDDIRPGKEQGITRGNILRMVSRSSLTNQTQANMIEVNFTQDANQDKNAGVVVSGLYICVCVDYLMAIADFFVKGLPQPGDQQPPVPTKAVSTANKPVTASSSQPPSSGSPAGCFNLSLAVNQPEIILVEDQMNPDTKALIMQTQVNFTLRMSPEMQSMGGQIGDLTIFSCAYALEKRAATKTLILSPTTVSLHSSAPNGRNMHVDVMVTDIVMAISPATIRTITATLSGLSAKPDEEAVDEVSLIPKDLWGIKKLADLELWYLKSDSGVDLPAVMDVGTDIDSGDTGRGEQLLLTVKKVVVMVEGGVGKRTLPLLITEMEFRSEVRDWSTQLYVTGDLLMEVAYYNEYLAVWEPLVEPVEEEGGGKHRSWELNLEVQQNNDLFLADDDVDGDAPTLPPPKMAVNVKSKDILQTTITKTCLEVLKNLGKAFGDAYNLVDMSGDHSGEKRAPYRIRNHTGQHLSLKLDSSFKMPEGHKAEHMELAHMDEISLYNNAETEKALAKKSVIKTTQEDHVKTVFVILEDLGVTRELRIVKAEKRAFGINQRAYPGDTWHLVSQTDANYGCKTVTLRSILAVHNHLPYAMELYYKLSDDAMGKCGEVAPDATLNVPMDAVYAAPYEIFFKPKDPRYVESKVGYRWKDVSGASSTQQHQTPITITCEAAPRRDPASQPLHFSAKVSVESVLFESSGEHSASLYTIHLHPVVVLRNHLPLPVSLSVEGDDTASVSCLEAGETQSLFNAKPGYTNVAVKILDYLNMEWIGKRLIEDKPEPLSVITFEASDGKTTMDLGVHCSVDKGYRELSLYCPYWMINRTGRDLGYKATDDYHVTQPADMKGVVLFSFKSKAFFGKKKASLQVGDSQWSDKFSLDTVGSQGTVSCKLKGFNLEVGVKITLASTGLTKVITFTPYYMLVNKAQFSLSVQEAGVDKAAWYHVPPAQCIPFWPTSTDKKKRMIVKVTDDGDGLETLPFCYVEPHATLLRLDNHYAGIHVECQVMEAAIELVFNQYKPGFACVQLVNHTAAASIQYQQNGVNEVRRLSPGQSVLYTWQDPLGKRELIWSSGEKKNVKDELLKDTIDQYFYDAETKVYYVSFLDGMQRVMLFTDDIALATKAQQAGELEQTDQEVTVSLAGLGLSLVDNTAGRRGREVAYMAITSSGVVWETRKKKMFKALKQKQIVLIEAAFQQYMMELAVGKSPKSRKSIDSKLEVDFGSVPMMMLKPNKVEIRRNFQEGIKLLYCVSPHRLQYHIKIHRLQLDNQLPGAVFPTVLAPTPPPKSVAAESVPKPFTEVSITIRKRDFSSVLQFKYFKILIQEMGVQVDQGFLNAIIALFASGEVDDEAQKAAFLADCQMIDWNLKLEADAKASNEQKHFYDILHFSPLKIHVSFSLYGAEKDGSSGAPTALQSDVLNLFLQSVGIVLTDIQDVVFKLGYFERNYTFYNGSELTGEITRHYTQQAIKQMYVLVLGLDVLGNPFGLIRGFAEGIEDLFYEPYQGAVQGPQEFAEGLALGVRSLFGHAVGGAAGAVSRITGALGKGLATLTMDDEYQQKRREALNKRPADLKEGLARGGKGLVMGVVDGVTGIVLKPVEGAKQEGAAGFFKGVGKGLMGVVTRPASGVVDFASSSFQGIQRVAETTDEVHRLRPPRFLHDDGIVRPFSFLEAEGNNTLNDVEKGRYAADVYVAHAVVTKDTKNVLLVTDKRVLFANKGDIFGHWDCEWQYVWEELKEPPTVTAKGIQILLKEKQKKSFFSSGTVGKLVPLPDAQLQAWLVGKMKEAMLASTTAH